MSLTAQAIKEFAARFNAEVGVANIERFANAPRRMHPSNIFPDCRSVVSLLMPIPRGTYRGISEGTHWANYTYYGYWGLNSVFRPAVTYDIACFIEDQGHEAVPVYPGVPEASSSRPPVRPDRPAPDVNLNVRIAGLACGLGEIGWSKVFISPKYGPRVRLGTILTDAELEPDPLVEPGTLCNRCMRCVKDCPGGAIPKPDECEPIQIRIEDKTYEWADVHMGRCTLTHHGLNWEVSPFLKKDFPGLDMNVRESRLSEEAAYRLSYPLALAPWRPTPEFPGSHVMTYYSQIMSQVGYYGLCGAKGCIRGCMDAMEKRHEIDQSDFATPVWPRPAWRLSPPSEDETGGVAEGKFPDEFNTPDPKPGAWQ